MAYKSEASTTTLSSSISIPRHARMVRCWFVDDPDSAAAQDYIAGRIELTGKKLAATDGSSQAVPLKMAAADQPLQLEYPQGAGDDVSLQHRVETGTGTFLLEVL